MPVKDKDYYRNYYRKHKADILEKMYEKDYCKICEKEISHHYMPKHKRTLKHLQNERYDVVNKLEATTKDMDMLKKMMVEMGQAIELVALSQ